jgi:ELP3 family radical SAM enzyme/protein acetyltransferase
MNNDQQMNIEDINQPHWYDKMSKTTIDKCYDFLDKYYNKNIIKSNIKIEFIKFAFANKFESVKFGYLIYLYQLGRKNGKYIIQDIELEKQLKVMSVRENSGVMVFSIFTSAHPSYTKHYDDNISEIVNDFHTNSENPNAFSCKYDCYYCPNEPGQPRSYLAGEPGVDRAISNNYNVTSQIIARATQYIQQGHPIDKCEVIIQGGTWDSYSYEYRREFIRDIYYTFNIMMDIFFKNNIRDKYSMEEEIKLNEIASCRVIGLTPETRPDQINETSIKFLRQIGATRVQIGVQHLDDNILRYINRRCYKKHTIRAIKMLKDCGFKVDIHIMPDLPAPPTYEGKMSEVDHLMFEELNINPDLKIDQMKIYPCMVTPYTKIKEWYDQGIYKPYGEDKHMTPEELIKYRRLSKEEKIKIRLLNPLYKNILDFYTKIHPSIRVNRIIRDIPVSIVCGGTKRSSLRSEIDRDMEALNMLSSCIRYREAGNSRNLNRSNKSEPIIKEICFEASEGFEYFISYESQDENPILYSFLRLRLSKNSGKINNKIIFPELVNTAIVRELHTYGKVIPCKDNLKYYKNNNVFINQDDSNKSQHKGFGKKLLDRAEEIARDNGYNRMAVISGVGVREYYRKIGYQIDSETGCYQIKHLKPTYLNRLITCAVIVLPFVINYFMF